MDPGIGTAGLVSMLQNIILFTTDAAANYDKGFVPGKLLQTRLIYIGVGP
jgi:hypothetical protein